jgi:predicted PurR-regulated permease PerM
MDHETSAAIASPRAGVLARSLDDGRRTGGSAPAGPGWPPRRILGAAFTAGAGALLAFVLLRATATVSGELVLVVLALVFALGLDPIVSWVERRGLRRGWGVLAVTAGLLLVLAGVLALLVPPIVTQGRQLAAALPGMLRQLQDRHSSIGRIEARYHLLERLRSSVSAGFHGGGLPVGGVLDAGLAVFGTVTAAVVVLVLTLYFLANLPAIRGTAYRFVPAGRRHRAQELGDEICARTGGYVLGNLITSVVAGLGTFVFLEIMGVPYAAALGVLVAVLDLIPVVGSTLGGIVLTLVALTVSVTVAIASVVFYIAYRLLEDYLLTPRVMNRTVQVPPVLTIVALLIGGSLLGIAGAFLAIPAAAAVQLVVTRVLWPRMDAA